MLHSYKPYTSVSIRNSFRSDCSFKKKAQNLHLKNKCPGNCPDKHFSYVLCYKLLKNQYFMVLVFKLQGQETVESLLPERQ